MWGWQENVLGCGGRKGRCGKRYERRRRKVCGGGNGRCRKGKGNDVREMWGSVVRSVLGSHTLIHFPTPPPFLSPHFFPSRQHTSPLTPYTLPHFSTPHTSFLPSPHTQHTSLHLPPYWYLFHSSPHLPLHPNTLPTHPMHSPAVLLTSFPTVSMMWQRGESQ